MLGGGNKKVKAARKARGNCDGNYGDFSEVSLLLGKNKGNEGS
jgi:hypothetical protein